LLLALQNFHDLVVLQTPVATAMAGSVLGIELVIAGRHYALQFRQPQAQLGQRSRAPLLVNQRALTAARAALPN